MFEFSVIMIQNPDRSVDAIYCHYDGHPALQLPKLRAYTTERSVRDLIALGDLSSLGSSLRSSVSYHRDRDQPLRIAHYENIDQVPAFKHAYRYIFRNNRWLVARPGQSDWRAPDGSDPAPANFIRTS